MAEISTAEALSLMPATEAGHKARGALLRELVIALTAFLTVLDLFATQAILPSSPPSGDRIVSGTTSMVAVSNVGYISVT